MNNDYLLQEIKSISDDVQKKILNAKDKSELLDIYNKYIASNGILSQKKNNILKSKSIVDKKTAILKINSFFDEVKKCFEAQKKSIINAELLKENEDISLPAFDLSVKGINPIHLIREKIIDIFFGMGFKIYHSNDIDDEYYNFTLMNIASNHVSRDMENTFYIDQKLLLCTHTSHAQGRAMEETKGKPLKIISPGKCFRKDDDDLTHSHQFMQIEGLMIDKNINLGNLKAILEIFVKKMFGENRKMRLRNSFFPFTEPSIEMDISCDNCCGVGCYKCKNTGYIEVLGAGIVNPKVLEMNGYNSKVYSGLAFGIGIERIAILKYGIDNIRRFYTNDIRFLKDFKG
ncbi:MAG: phenylalanine--tRNA ligase subunit alpha [Bacilli bacterium]|nr:phenylalanine--tRNA ligase subunit alpha [Bacilli bacterium]